MPQPKKKTSHQKQAQRRASNYLRTIQILPKSSCTNCGTPKLPHMACAECGYYRGRPARRREWLVGS
ncbi:MAG: 50S ribosomal protein L32 [Candidatus Obscuribacterales bacterium]|nr:50S ribosomal protein L32 [Candidatus Obscuribacterales bacterium]